MPVCNEMMKNTASTLAGSLFQIEASIVDLREFGENNTRTL